jgi:plasmid maintenance system antidote protein VapI
MSEPLTVTFRPTDLARAAGISVPYASQIISGAKPLHRSLAIKIWDEFKLKLGPIAEASDEDIEVLRRYEIAA